ncbi:MAG TPA: hypothetical protein VKE74_26360 [Gemmataceae bacterium]|nr:hypothetical protein [Gemmataceae bacterium]
MSAMVIALGLAMGASAQAEAFPPPQFHITATVFKGDPLGSRAEGTVEVLSRPQIQVLPGQTGCVQVGGQVPVLRGTQAIEYNPTGLRLKVTPQPRPDGTVLLDLEAQVTTPCPTPVDLGNGLTAVAFNTQSVATRRVVRDTQTVRVRIAADSPTDQTWAELTLHIVRP